MDAGPRIESYDRAGGRETMLRFGPAEGPVAVLALPLFEEANRVRAFAVTLLRALSERGIGGALPDLPGTGESSVDIADTTIMAMRDAFEAVVAQAALGRAYAISIRSGALLDTHALVDGRWHLASMTGAELLRELARLPASEPAADWIGDRDEPPVEIAGNRISRRMLSELTGIFPFSELPGEAVRTVRIDTDPRAADLKVAGVPPWRRAEPGNDPALAALLADDIATWIARCEG